MIELASRIPIQLTPRQTVLVVALAIGLLIGLLVAATFETVLSGVIAFVLRITGHPPPRKSSFSRVLDELEQKTRERK
jgi:hypothetical protein